MKVNKPDEIDELKEWASVADGLCKLKMGASFAHEFTDKYSKYLTHADRVEMASINSKYDQMFWKYWERLVRKIRGI